MGALWTIIGASAALMVLLPLGLPVVAALDPDLSYFGVVHWVTAPLLAGMLTAGLLARRAANPPLPIPLPQELTGVFSLSTIALLLLGASLLDDPLWDQHPGLLIVGGSSYAGAAGLFVYGHLRRTLATVAPPLGASRPRGRPISARQAILTTTLAVAGVGTLLMTLHSENRRLRDASVHSATQLEMLMDLSLRQIQGQAKVRVHAYLSKFPDPDNAWPALLAADGTILASPKSEVVGSRLRERGMGHCQVGRSALLCLTRRLAPGRRLAMLSPPQRVTIGPLVGLGSLLLLTAALLGLALGREAIGDIARVTQRLQRFALDDQPDLHEPLTVGSVDEVGDMVAAVEALRKRLQADLDSYAASLEKTQEAEEQRNRFLADVSHELRTPLNTICGYSQLLLEGIEGELSEHQRADVEAIHRSGDQLTALINDVLDLSVLEAGGLQLHLEAVDVGQLGSELLTQFRGVIRTGDKAERLRLEGKIAPDLPALRADPVRLRQVLQNLLSNALRHTSEGEVRLAIARQGEHEICIEVEDSGEGISVADMPSIFDEYAQVGKAGARRGGTGLGLAICKRLVELHGGQIRVESELGAGTCFRVTLPWAGPQGAGGKEHQLKGGSRDDG